VTTLPEDREVTFVVCETVREEKGGKLSLLGLYPGNRLNVPQDTIEATLPLALVFFVDGGSGLFKSSASLISPTGKAVVDKSDLPDHDKKEDAANVVLMQLIPFKTTDFGTFKVLLQLDDRTYERTFSINKGPVQPHDECG
jgi:hypothetical protein